MPKNNILPKGVLFTTIPDHFLTHIMTDLSASELRVMLYVYLHTLGYGKQADTISYDQFVNGITTRDGRRLDYGAGVSRRSLVSALVALEKRKLITRHYNGYCATTIQLEFVELEPSKEDSSSEQKEVASLSCASLKPGEETLSKAETSLTQAVYESDKPLKVVEMRPGKRSDKSEEVQYLPAANGDGVQNLPVNLQTQVQILHPTEELTGFKHEDINRGYNPTSAELSAIKIIRDKVADISCSEALRLVKIAFNEHRRDERYISRLVDYISLNPTIYKPAAVLTTLIKKDQDRTLGVAFAQNNQPFDTGKVKPGVPLDTGLNLSYTPALVSFKGGNYEKVFQLLVQKGLLLSPSKARHYVQLASEQHISPSELEKIVWEALRAVPGQRSASFETRFNQLSANFSMPKVRSTFGSQNGFDFSKYTGNGKYAFLARDMEAQL